MLIAQIITEYVKDHHPDWHIEPYNVMPYISGLHYKHAKTSIWIKYEETHLTIEFNGIQISIRKNVEYTNPNMLTILTKNMQLVQSYIDEN